MGLYQSRVSEVRIDPAKLALVLRGRDGPAARNVIERAERVKTRAKELVGKDTHKLEQSIVTRFVDEPAGPAMLVGSEEPHALLHHEGTQPHEIVPRIARVLRFPARGGGFVFAMRVRHPGTQPNRYLVDALPAAGDTG